MRHGGCGGNHFAPSRIATMAPGAAAPPEIGGPASLRPPLRRRLLLHANEPASHYRGRVQPRTACGTTTTLRTTTARQASDVLGTRAGRGALRVLSEAQGAERNRSRVHRMTAAMDATRRL